MRLPKVEKGEQKSERNARIIALAAKGISLREISKLMGVDEKTTRNILRTSVGNTGDFPTSPHEYPHSPPADFSAGAEFRTPETLLGAEFRTQDGADFSAGAEFRTQEGSPHPKMGQNHTDENRITPEIEQNHGAGVTENNTSPQGTAPENHTSPQGTAPEKDAIYPPYKHVIRNLHTDSIPAKLKSINQWVLWRWVERKGQLGKWTKPPFQVSGNDAKVNDPTTWATFGAALAARNPGRFSGIGIVLTPELGIVGVDLDHCLNPATRELESWAKDIVDALPTYWEISPSGEGLRGFVKGTLPQEGRKKGHVEMYNSGRYVTVTGHQFGGMVTDENGIVNDAPTEIAELPDKLLAVHTKVFTKEISKESPKTFSPVVTSLPFKHDDHELFALIRRGKKGASFDALMAGDTSAYADDNSAADMGLCNILAFYTGKDAVRMDRIFRQSGLMREKWDKAHHSDGQTYGQGTINRAIMGCREVYSGGNIARQQQQPKQQPTVPWTGTQPEENKYRGTDDANALLFLGIYGEDVRYCPPWDKWLLWSGSHWAVDESLKIQKLTFDVPRMIYRETAKESDKEQRKWLGELARKLENTTKRANMLTSVKPRVVVHHKELDKGHFLLNVGNGTIDLKTGDIRPHKRADLLTHDNEIEYHRDATAPTWERFLVDIFEGDVELVEFVQRAIGYSLTGNVKEQVLFICHGGGENGKSKFFEVLLKILGTLSIQAAPDLLMADIKQRHPTEQADLFGKRVVSCQETGEGRRFNETLVKQLTGGDAIRARRMHEDFWQFDPTHKLWLSTNHKPEIRGTDHAIWRRIRLIPFNVKFTIDGAGGTRVRDSDMSDKLMAELPGILTWAVNGCLAWQRNGLKPPKAVTQATNSYQVEMDVLAAWMTDCCVVNRVSDARAADLYDSYSQWCEQSGERPEPQRKFGTRLSERGFESRKSTGGRNRWLGIGLLAPDESGASGVSGPETKVTGSPTSLTSANLESSSTSSTSSAFASGEGLSDSLSVVINGHDLGGYVLSEDREVF